MRTTRLFLVLLPSLLLIGACEGPEGPAGPTGLTGPTGAQGLPGDPGTANVIYSPWTSFTEAWRDTVIDNSTFKYQSMEAPSLSQGIMDTGTILAFMKFSGMVFQLPYTSYAGTKLSTLDFMAQVQRMYFLRFTHDNSGSVGVGVSVTFRYILIPGGVSETPLKRALAIHWEDMSYPEVCDLLDIPE